MFGFLLCVWRGEQYFRVPYHFVVFYYIILWYRFVYEWMMYYRNKNHFKRIFVNVLLSINYQVFILHTPGEYSLICLLLFFSPPPPPPPPPKPTKTNKVIVNMLIFCRHSYILLIDFSCYSSQFMIKIAEPGTNSNEFLSGILATLLHPL